MNEKNQERKMKNITWVAKHEEKLFIRMGCCCMYLMYGKYVLDFGDFFFF